MYTTSIEVKHETHLEGEKSPRCSGFCIKMGSLSPALVTSKLKPEEQTFAQRKHMKCDVMSSILKHPVYTMNKTLRPAEGGPSHSVRETGHQGTACGYLVASVPSSSTNLT